MAEHFGDRLAAAVTSRGPLCIGLDPYPDRIPAIFGDAHRYPANTFEVFCSDIITRAASRAAAIKPQIALFERYGPAALAALGRLTERAREMGLLVILDAKRGDIADTARGYAEAYLGPQAWLHADAVTVNPYLGADSIAPWLEVASANGRGVVALLRTSNPGAADLQDVPTAPEGVPLWERTAAMLAPLADGQKGASGWSSVMAVVGATAPEQARRARTLLPSVPFLAPGYGAQGASAADALAGAVASADGPQGVLAASSRAVLYPAGAEAAADRVSWGEMINAAMDAAQAELQNAPAPA